MRILQLCSAFAYTGPAEPMLSLSIELSRRGHALTIGHDTIRPHGNAHEEGIGPRVAASGLPVATELALNTQSGPITWMRDFTRLRARMAGVDVTHTHFSHDFGLAVAARVTGIQSTLIRTVHAERSINGLLRRADAVIVHSNHAKALVEKHLPSARIHVIHGAVDVERFHPRNRANRDAFRARHHLPSTGPALLMAAIFQAGRGQSELVRMWPAVRAIIPDAQLWFAGLGEERDDVMQLAKGIPGIHFLGYLKDDLPDAFAAADASVLLRIGNDGYGRAALESLASGTAVLTRKDAHAVADVVEKHGVGRLLDVDAVDQVIRVLREPVPPERCRSAVEKDHTISSVTSQTEAVYKAVLRPVP